MQSAAAVQPGGAVPRALNPAEAWWAALDARSDRSALAFLHTETTGGRAQRSVYELFSEMEEKDAHLYAVLQTRLNGLLGLVRRVVPSGAEADAREAAAFVEAKLGAIPRLPQLLRTLLDAVAKGLSVVELVWDYDAAGELCIADWIAHPQEWFAFSAEDELLLLAPPFREPAGAPAPPEFASAPGRTSGAARRAFRAPARKFIAARFGADFRNPYGRGLCHRAYWLYWFKKNALKFWSIYNERFGAPAAIATYGPGTSPEERQRLRDILDALQTDSGIVVPDTVRLQLLETAKAGAGTYREFLDWCNDEMSKAVLGATLTSGEGRRSGSLALGGIHQLVRQDYIEADARFLEGLLDETIVRWICELNLGSGAPRPRFAIETASPEDLSQRIAVDRALLGIGLPLPQGYFYGAYGRPAPAEGEPLLRYDDANFYQYHLQFGVLSINEVRTRLGLDPVPWGNARTSSAIANPGASGEDRGDEPK